MRYGMRALSNWSLLALTGLSIAFGTFSYMLAGSPPLVTLMIYFMTAFFCVGILFGNLNSIAMEPLGHIAGVGAAVVGSLSTFISVLLGTLIGQGYNGDEINGKSRSLKGVLEPFSTQGNLDLLQRAGFVDVMTVFKYMCFEGFLAIK